MFNILYAKNVYKDLRKFSKRNLSRIKKGIEELEKFPDIPQIKYLNNHPLADYRIRVGDYRILFDVDWENKEIHILKIGHRKNVY